MSVRPIRWAVYDDSGDWIGFIEYAGGSYEAVLSRITDEIEDVIGTYTTVASAARALRRRAAGVHR